MKKFGTVLVSLFIAGFLLMGAASVNNFASLKNQVNSGAKALHADRNDTATAYPLRYCGNITCSTVSTGLTSWRWSLDEIPTILVTVDTSAKMFVSVYNRSTTGCSVLTQVNTDTSLPAAAANCAYSILVYGAR